LPRKVFSLECFIWKGCLPALSLIPAGNSKSLPSAKSEGLISRNPFLLSDFQRGAFANTAALPGGILGQNCFETGENSVLVTTGNSNVTKPIVSDRWPPDCSSSWPKFPRHAFVHSSSWRSIDFFASFFLSDNIDSHSTDGCHLDFCSAKYIRTLPPFFLPLVLARASSSNYHMS
jgi:hypothetical protein